MLYKHRDRYFLILHTIISDLGQRQKAHLIADDLLSLIHSRDKPIVIFKVRKVTPAYALGMLYVVEGASLGGRYILKNVEKISGLDGKRVFLILQDMGSTLIIMGYPAKQTQ